MTPTAPIATESLSQANGQSDQLVASQGSVLSDEIEQVATLHVVGDEVWMV